jgi:hypothetical protein
MTISDQFAVDLLESIDQDEHFLHNVFSDEATFHLSGKLNRHSCRIWGSEIPHSFREYERDGPKINVWCALSYIPVTEPFLFHYKTVNSVNYLDTLELYTVLFHDYYHTCSLNKVGHRHTGL